MKSTQKVGYRRVELLNAENTLEKLIHVILLDLLGRWFAIFTVSFDN